MVTTRTCRLESIAAALFELADLVERFRLSAADIGGALAETYTDASQPFDDESQADLERLCDSATSPADFARGLRRQAEAILQQTQTATACL